MRELEVFAPEAIDDEKRARLMIFVCDESTIRCDTIRRLQKEVLATGLPTVLVMPDNQFERGKRGWAKAQILASVVGNLEGVMPVDSKTLAQELEKNWGAVRINGPIAWIRSETFVSQRAQVAPGLEIIETTDQFDRNMIGRANGTTRSSNCWQDPAGCIFVRDGEVLIESVATNFNDSNCRGIPIEFKEIFLDSGERMMFCDSLHSERVGISQAAEKGISLKGSTMYVTKFPCRSCAQSAIAAGVTSIVFDRGSYGLTEAADLFERNNITLKKVVD